MLNAPQKSYTGAQLLDVVAFSSLLRFLHAAPRAISPELRDAVLAYCARLVEQSGAAAGFAGDSDDEAESADGEQSGAGGSDARTSGGMRRVSSSAAARLAARINDAQFVAQDEAAALAEMARVLLALHARDASIAPRAVALLRRAAERLPGGAASRAEHAHAHCSLLGAALTLLRDTSVMADLAPLLRSYFTVFLPRHSRSPEAAFETFAMARQHSRALATGVGGGGNAFASYFPALLKLFAWSPVTHANDVRALLPLMANNATFIELLHLLLDVPLVAAALERQECEGDSVGTVDASDDGGKDDADSTADERAASGGGGGDESKRGAERVLYNLLLRSEAGVSFNMWQRESTTLPLLLAFAVQTPLTPLVEAVCERTVPLVETLLNDVLLPHTAGHAQLLAALFARIEYVAALGSYGGAVRTVMCHTVRRLLASNPELLVSQSGAIVALLSDHAPQQLDLMSDVVYAIGRYVDDTSVAEQYFQHLEIMAYELSSARADDAAQQRLAMLVLSAMCKLACVAHETLAPRALLCLVSKLRSTSASEALRTRCHELLRLVRNPQVGRDLFEHYDTGSAQSLTLEVVSHLR